jgi:hypothetical protein
MLQNHQGGRMTKGSYSDGIECKHFSLNDIRRLMAKNYDGIPNGESIHRDMLVHKSRCNYGGIGCIFFALNGSPPKGYAIYSPQHGFLLIVDIDGKTRKITYDYGITVDGLDDLKDFDIIKGEKEEKIHPTLEKLIKRKSDGKS